MTLSLNLALSGGRIDVVSTGSSGRGSRKCFAASTSSDRVATTASAHGNRSVGVGTTRSGTGDRSSSTTSCIEKYRSSGSFWRHRRTSRSSQTG